MSMHVVIYQKKEEKIYPLAKIDTSRNHHGKGLFEMLSIYSRNRRTVVRVLHS